MKYETCVSCIDEKWIVWAAANDILDNWWHPTVRLKMTLLLASQTYSPQKEKLTIWYSINFFLVIFLEVLWRNDNSRRISNSKAMHFWVTTTHGLKRKGLKYPINCSKLCNFSDFFHSCMKIHTSKSRVVRFHFWQIFVLLPRMLLQFLHFKTFFQLAAMQGLF